MAKVIYRVLDSNDKAITVLDEYVLKSGSVDEMAEYWRTLVSKARKKKLFISIGIGSDATIWMKAYTQGHSSIRRYEFINQ